MEQAICDTSINGLITRKSITKASNKCGMCADKFDALYIANILALIYLKRIENNNMNGSLIIFKNH